MVQHARTASRDVEEACDQSVAIGEAGDKKKKTKCIGSQRYKVRCIGIAVFTANERVIRPANLERCRRCWFRSIWVGLGAQSKANLSPENPSQGFSGSASGLEPTGQPCRQRPDEPDCCGGTHSWGQGMGAGGSAPPSTA